MQGKYLSFFFYCDDREPAIDGVSSEVEPVTSSGKWMLTSRIILNSGSDVSIRRTLILNICLY